jgi:hypothetical protein
VLQERLLSRRTIFFGNLIYWECSEILANEVFPNGIPRSFDLPGTDAHFRLGALLKKKSENATDEYQSDSENYDGWGEIVERFTQCSLSHDADFLPALSGLAYSFQTELVSQYHAGLWRK